MNVLLVDDEEVVLKSVGGFLERCGHRVRTAADGADALGRMSEKLPDVVITDIRMPNLDGLELLGVLKVRFPGTPVVLITGHGDVDTAVSALQRGAFDYVRKPLRLETLVAILDRIEERRSLEQSLVEERTKLTRAGQADAPASGDADGIAASISAVQKNLQALQGLWARVEPALVLLNAQGEGGRDLSLFLNGVPELVSDMLADTEQAMQMVHRDSVFSTSFEATGRSL